MIYRYLAVAVLARFADEGARVALLLLALDTTGSTFFGGALAAAFMVPHVLAASAVGVIADRARRRAPVYALFLGGYGAALAVCGLLTGVLPAAVVLLVAVLGGACAPLGFGGLSSLIKELFPAGRRDRVYGLDVMTYNLAGICGPATAAVVAETPGPRAATLLLGGGALTAGLVVLSLPLTRREAPAATLGGMLTGGFGAIWRIRRLRAVTLATSLGAGATGAFPLIAALLAIEYHAGYASGALLSAAAIGGMAGSLLYARYPIGARRPERTVMICLVASALPLAAVPFVPGVIPAALLFGAAGFFFGPQSAALFTSRDRHAPAAVHTQVFTLGAGLKVTTAALGTALAGYAAGAGAHGLLFAAAGVHAAAGVLGAAVLARD
ncbi:MFS transporter [Catenuloplanes atrovinosus]|uniref:MFS family permease n=1 Tax=Catenuloplanes atrovinosus TaxID=137266 RepID=A0AAE4CF97_9ACTN|nr:MFS transporter [Catenuloplanes atrovinosus]MDR7280829.1 MFS family permease [Catenuloplanes atrovinosus]